jgi:hypothetical protein
VLIRQLNDPGKLAMNLKAFSAFADCDDTPLTREEKPIFPSGGVEESRLGTTSAAHHPDGEF